PGVAGEWFHRCCSCVTHPLDRRPAGNRFQSKSSGEDNVPRTAVAAATNGETRCVRPPLPCLPSKLRLDVDALRSPEVSWSGFMPRHMEQPAERHSAPALRKTSFKPSSS